MPTLILTPRFTDDAQILWRTAGRLGWRVERLRSWTIPDDLKKVEEPVFYLEALFGPTLALEFSVTLEEPPADWLPQLPDRYRQRNVQLLPLGVARLNQVPAFVKPPNDKSFPAGVYRGEDLPQEFPEEMPVLVAEIVQWENEFRCFVLDRKVVTLSIYLRSGVLQSENGYAASVQELAEAKEFADQVISDERVHLGRTAVLDVGKISGRGWAVVEQNAAWGSGIYGCDPVEVLRVLQHTAISRTEARI